MAQLVKGASSQKGLGTIVLGIRGCSLYIRDVLFPFC